MNKKVCLRKALVLASIMLFVGASIIPSTFGTIEKKTMFKEIRSPGYIQNLIDNASDGDTIYIPSGTYYENIIINKSISLIGEDKGTTIIDGGGNDSVISISADWVNISGFTIQKSGDGLVDAGINIRSNYNTISDNKIILNNENGIYLSFSNGNKITRNFISYNVDDGIDFDDSNDNTITSNTITNNIPEGIQIEDSINNNIANNTISNNGAGIYLKDGSNKNIITDNNISNNSNYGISLVDSFLNNIYKNNFIDNKKDAFFRRKLLSIKILRLNRWKQNYWDSSRILPKLIFGEIYWITYTGGWIPHPVEHHLPWIPQFDWRPALRPYDI